MQKFMLFIAAIMMTLSFGLVDADAKRMGGGRSMGMQRSVDAPTRHATPPSAPAPAPGMAPQAPKRGFGWGGALAGLAAGGLLGALLFGGGFHGINPMDIIVMLGLALIVFLVFRAMRRKQESRPMAYAGLGGHPSQESAYTPQVGGSSMLDNPEPYSSGATYSVGRPAGFDEAEFLHGAKAAFIRLQAAWDAKDVDDIRRFTTPEMFGELSAEIQEMGNSANRTDVLNVTPILLDVAQEADRLVASVRYDALIREDAQADAQQILETWHFVKPVNSNNPTWYLAGIQQG